MTRALLEAAAILAFMTVMAVGAICTVPDRHTQYQFHLARGQ